MKRTKVKKYKPLKPEDQTNDKLAEHLFGKRLKKKLDKIAHSGELGHKSNEK